MANYSGRIKEYWADVNVMEGQLREDAAKLTLGLRNGAAYVISLSVDRGSNSATPGKISEVTLRDAAKLSIDGTHRLATDAEIEAYLRDMKTRRSIASATGAASLKTIGLGRK